MFSRIDHIALHIKDIKISVNFYKEVFGFSELLQQRLANGKTIVYLQLGNTILELSEFYEGRIQGGHFCLHTPTFKAAYDLLIAKNIPLLQAPHSTAARTPHENDWMRAVFLGPDGEQIEIRG
jgi:lactoylglutathione lyase